MCVLYVFQLQGKRWNCLGGTAGLVGVEGEGKVRKISSKLSVTLVFQTKIN